MFQKSLVSLGCSAMLLAAASDVGAATHTLELAGDVGFVIPGSFESSGNLFHTGFLSLDVLTSSTPQPLVVNVGDIIEFTVTLTNGPFVVPASPNQFIGIDFRGETDPVFNNTPGSPPVVTGFAEFFFDAAPIPLSGPVFSNSGSCGNCPALLTFEANAPSRSFDRIVANLTFENLTAPYDIRFDGISLSYQNSQPVPEPETYAMMLAGLGLVGVAAMRRRRKAAAR